MGDGQVCEIPGVGPVPLSLATDLLGEAICHLVITDGCDVTTTCGLGRNVPVSLQRALRERDPVCVVPGCDQPRGIEIDHRVIDFKDDGPTMLWNLARLCIHHHRLRTHQGFVLERRTTGWVWRTPDGREVTDGDTPKHQGHRGHRPRPATGCSHPGPPPPPHRVRVRGRVTDAPRGSPGRPRGPSCSTGVIEQSERGYR